jgi:cytoskeletal protein RodZ
MYTYRCIYVVLTTTIVVYCIIIRRALDCIANLIVTVAPNAPPPQLHFQVGLDDGVSNKAKIAAQTATFTASKTADKTSTSPPTSIDVVDELNDEEFALMADDDNDATPTDTTTTTTTTTTTMTARDDNDGFVLLQSDVTPMLRNVPQHPSLLCPENVSLSTVVRSTFDDVFIVG